MKPTLFFQRREVKAELLRVKALADDRNVVGLIGMLDSQLRGVTQYSIVRSHAAKWLGRRVIRALSRTSWICDMTPKRPCGTR